MMAAKGRRRVGLSASLLGALITLACGTPQTAAVTKTEGVEVVRIWPGPPPGTENWTGSEVELDADVPGAGKVHIVTNVTTPTLTIVRPESGKANGSAMLVLPGGAFRALVWDLDGLEVAHWLARRGITAFVLKYRVRPPGDQGAPQAESFDDFFRRTQPARDVAIADGQQSLRYIRANAAKYGVSKGVGAIGFSAGAMTTMGLALGTEAATRPDFAVSVYGAMAADRQPPPDAPPLFIVAAQDDPQVPSGRSVEIYERWTQARLPAELHLYEKGGHGFGMRTRNKPLDKWPEALEAWLQSRRLAEAASSQTR